MAKKQQGFAHIAIVIVLICIMAIGGVGYVVISRDKSKESGKSAAPSSSSDTLASADTCEAAHAGQFTEHVTEFDNITLIQTPIRLIAGTNIKSHSYIEVGKKSAIYAPMDATLSGGANYYETMGPNPVTKVQYLLSFNDACDVSFWLDHVVDVTDKVKDAFPPQAQDSTKSVEVKQTEFKAGELIGYTNQNSKARFDFGVIDLKSPETSLTTNPRFKDDPIVQTSDKYRHAICPYSLYSADNRAKYQKLYYPAADPDQEIIDDICAL